MERGGEASASCRRPGDGRRGRGQPRRCRSAPAADGARPLREALNFQLRPGSGGRTIQHGSGGGRDHSARQPEGRPASALPPRPCAVRRGGGEGGGRRGGGGHRLPLPPRRAGPGRASAARALPLDTCPAGPGGERGRRWRRKKKGKKKRKERSPLSPPPPAPDGARRDAGVRRGPARGCPGGRGSRRVRA